MNVELKEIWDNYPYAVTVSDVHGILVYMNKKAEATFDKWGGGDLIGKNMYDCHSQTSRDKMEVMLKTGTSNTYTIEKNGQKKLIHQAPWFKNNEVAGLVEISIVLPENMPHFIRG
ncbi:MAG: hypothetical protein CVU05_03660 [Bacteroidetes bacterium HGW-Bacteroidetes-21]|jgi:transcriptional regulator with PAS, ATPase and Fis domain|nr:MAG: hypothetical protein CVU05_03660 [Bacteroidetes bacterium HGW-Bacteroidetes-21]